MFIVSGHVLPPFIVLFCFWNIYNEKKGREQPDTAPSFYTQFQFNHKHLLEEWKTLAASDRNDDIWAAQKENFIFLTALGGFALATNILFTGNGNPLGIYAAWASILLLIINFFAIEGINNHQFARRKHLQEIEKVLSMKFYTRQNKLMKDQQPFWLLHGIYSLRGLRLLLISFGWIYFVVLSTIYVAAVKW